MLVGSWLPSCQLTLYCLLNLQTLQRQAAVLERQKLRLTSCLHPARHWAPTHQPTKNNSVLLLRQLFPFLKTDILSLYNMNVKFFPLTPLKRPQEGAVGIVGGSAMSRDEARLCLTFHLGEQVSPGNQLEEEKSVATGIRRTLEVTPVSLKPKQSCAFDMWIKQ